MSRKNLFENKVETKEDTLESKLNEYIDKKSTADKLTKEVKSLSEDIKQLMIEKGETKISQNGYNISCSERETVKVDEDKLISVLKKNNVNAIKLKEVIDEDVLESKIYNGELSKKVLEEIQSCQTVTKSNVLTMRKGK